MALLHRNSGFAGTGHHAVSTSCCSITRLCSRSSSALSVITCQALGSSSSSSVLRSSSRGGNTRHSRRSTESLRQQERKPEDLLKACTHRNVNEHLLVLMDPKRERLIYVLGVASIASLEKQLPGVLQASEVGTSLFLDEAARKRLAVPQGVLTVFDVNADGTIDENLDSAFRNSVGTSFKHWDVLVSPTDNSQGAASSSQPQGSSARNPRVACHSRVRPVTSDRRRRNMTYTQWQRYHLGNRPRRRAAARWQSLFAEYSRMAHAFSLGPGTMAVMNSDIDTMASHMGPVPDPTILLMVKLGDSPRDWTLQITLRQARRRSKGTRRNKGTPLQSLEQILQEESAYLSNMQRLEEQWNSSSSSGRDSQLLLDWDRAQSMLSTTGRAKNSQDAAVAGPTDPAAPEASGASTAPELPGAQSPVPALLPRPELKEARQASAAPECSTSDHAADSAVPSARRDEDAWAAQQAMDRLVAVEAAAGVRAQLEAAARAQQEAVARAQEEPLSVALTSQVLDDDATSLPPLKRPETKRPSYVPRSIPLTSTSISAMPPPRPPPPSATAKPATPSEQPEVKEDSSSSSSSRPSAAGQSGSRSGAAGRAAPATPLAHLLTGGTPPQGGIKITLPTWLRSVSSEDEGEEQQQQQQQQAQALDFKNFANLIAMTPKGTTISIIVPDSAGPDRDKIHEYVEAALAQAGLSNMRPISIEGGSGSGGMRRRLGSRQRRLQVPDAVVAMGARKKGLRGARSMAASTPAAAPAEDAAHPTAAAQPHPTIERALAQLRTPAHQSAAFGQDLLLVAEPWALAPLAAAWHASELRVMHPGLLAPGAA